MNAWLQADGLPHAARQQALQKELDRHEYHQRRNEQARRSHTKTRHSRFKALGIDVTRIKSCVVESPYDRQ